MYFLYVLYISSLYTKILVCTVSIKSQEKSTFDVTLKSQESEHEMFYGTFECLLQAFLLSLSQLYFKLRDSCILYSFLTLYSLWLFNLLIFYRVWLKLCCTLFKEM